MVVFEIQVNGEAKPLYMDGQLHTQLIEKVQPAVQKKDSDFVIAIDGEERAGKSVFAMQIAKVLYPDFNEKNVCFTPKEFIGAVTSARRFSCIVFDEAFTGLSSRASLSEVNNLLVSLMMEMGQRNLFIIIVLPTVFLMDKYVALHRAKGLFHVYQKEGKRGYWCFYDRKRLKTLFLKGKKMYEYNVVKSMYFGRFQDQYVIEEQAYRDKKRSALKLKVRRTREDKYKEQRDALIRLVNDKLEDNQHALSEMIKVYGIKLDNTSISKILNQSTP